MKHIRKTQSKYTVENKSAGLNRADQFSFEVVGQLMKDILND